MSNCGQNCNGVEAVDCNVTDARCVIYNKEDLTPSQLLCFIGASNGTPINKILEDLDSKLCEYLSVTLLPCFRDVIDVAPDETLSINEFLIHLQEYICNSSDEKVKTSVGDPEAGYLYDKITVGPGLNKNINIVDGYRSVHITINPEELATLVQPFITIPNCYEIDCTPCEQQQDCTPKPLTPVIVKNTGSDGKAILSCTSCNGIITWYNEEDVVVGYGQAIPVLAGTYYATSQTVCGTSEASNSITVAPYNVYTYIKSNSFTRNNCPDNGCGTPCIGSSVMYSKTYISYISQQHAQQLANTDGVYSTEGQNKANLEGTCDCPSCNCIIPSYVNATKNNPTCSGNILQSNGNLSITGISNATKFGISYGSIGYNGPNYLNSHSLGYSSSNISSTATSISITSLSTSSIIIRMFNGEEACYRDLVFSFVIPSCTGGGGSIELGDVTVSCEI